MNASDIKSMIDNGLQSAQVCIPCVVTAFVKDGLDEPYVNVIPSIRNKIYVDREPVYIDREEIEEVPIGYYSTQDFAVTMPISPGDRGFLIATDYNIDNWNVDGDEQADPYDSSFKNYGNSCFFVPGGWPRPKGVSTYSEQFLEIRTIDNRTNIRLMDGMIQLNADNILMNGIKITTVNPALPASFVPLPPVSPNIPEPVNRP